MRKLPSALLVFGGKETLAPEIRSARFPAEPLVGRSARNSVNSGRGDGPPAGISVARRRAVQTLPPTVSESRARGGWDVRVLVPYASVNSHDLDRVFGRNGLHPVGVRLQRLTACSKILVLYHSRVVGIVAYENREDELRVHELAIANGTDCRPEKIADVALDALELACLAGGARRLVVTSRAGTFRLPLWRRGFVRIDKGCAGSWLEKMFR